jgi:hypothetical protein
MMETAMLTPMLFGLVCLGIGGLCAIRDLREYSQSRTCLMTDGTTLYSHAMQRVMLLSIIGVVAMVISVLVLVHLLSQHVIGLTLGDAMASALGM